jgi:hypothetical protein
VAQLGGSQYHSLNGDGLLGVTEQAELLRDSAKGNQLHNIIF